MFGGSALGGGGEGALGPGMPKFEEGEGEGGLKPPVFGWLNPDDDGDGNGCGLLEGLKGAGDGENGAGDGAGEVVPVGPKLVDGEGYEGDAPLE